MADTKEVLTSIANTKKHFDFDVLRMLVAKFLKFLKRYFSVNLGLKWALFSTFSFILVSAYIIISPLKINPNIDGKYTIYSAKPLVLGGADVRLYAKDARSQRINEIFKQYNCPLEGLGEIFVMEADKNDIPWWVVAAIAFQESSCGKMTPEVLGVESFNAWGWAVYGDNVQMFNNWVRGIETVSEYLSKRFYSKGTTDLCEIMKTYTPPSKGSWCEGVKFFGDEILHYKTPQL